MLTDMNDAPQERARGEDDGATGDFLAGCGFDAYHPAALEQDIGGLSLEDRNIFDLSNGRLHRFAVKLAVGLSPWPPYGGALCSIKDAKLDAGRIRNPSHEPVERVDLADQMAFAEPPNGRIAGHCADGVEGMGHEGRAGAHPRGGRSRLAAGMASSHHDHIEPACHAHTPQNVSRETFLE